MVPLMLAKQLMKGGGGGGGGGANAAVEMLKNLALVALVLCFLALAAMVALLVVNVPPRAFKAFNLAEDSVKLTLLTFDAIVARFAAEHGLAMAAWWAELETVKRRRILDAWAARGRSSVHTGTFVSLNADAEKARARGLDDSPVGTFYTFEGMAPVPLVVSCRSGVPTGADSTEWRGSRRQPELALEPGALLADIELWRDLADFDPVAEPLTAADVKMLRSVENADLFLEALPVYVESLRVEHALYRYLGADIAQAKVDEMLAAGAGTQPPTLGCSLLELRLAAERPGAEGAAGRARLREAGGGYLDKLDRAVARRVAAALRDTRGAAKELGWGRLEASEPDEALAGRAAARWPVPVSWSCADAVEAAGRWRPLRARARAAVSGGPDEADAVRALVETGPAEFEAMASSLAAAETEAASSRGGGSAGLSNDAERAAWDRLLDLLVPDRAGLREAAESLAAIRAGKASLRSACYSGASVGSGAATSAAGAKYLSYLNALNAASYAAGYMRPAKLALNRTYVSPSKNKSFWCAFFADITAAYITKNTRQPRQSELGAVYDVESLIEYTLRFWNVKYLTKRLKDLVGGHLASAMGECSRSYKFARTVAHGEFAGTAAATGAVFSYAVPAGAVYLRLVDPDSGKDTGALRWPEEDGKLLGVDRPAEGTRWTPAGERASLFVIRVLDPNPRVGSAGGVERMRVEVVSSDGVWRAAFDPREGAFVCRRRVAGAAAQAYAAELALGRPIRPPLTASRRRDLQRKLKEAKDLAAKAAAAADKAEAEAQAAAQRGDRRAGQMAKAAAAALSKAGVLSAAFLPFHVALQADEQGAVAGAAQFTVASTDSSRTRLGGGTLRAELACPRPRGEVKLRPRRAASANAAASGPAGPFVFELADGDAASGVDNGSLSAAPLAFFVRREGRALAAPTGVARRSMPAVWMFDSAGGAKARVLLAPAAGGGTYIFTEAGDPPYALSATADGKAFVWTSPGSRGALRGLGSVEGAAAWIVEDALVA